MLQRLVRGRKPGPHCFHAEQAALLRGGDDRGGFAGIDSQRLFHQNVPPPGQTKQGMSQMQIVGRGDVNDIKIVVAGQRLVAVVVAINVVHCRKLLRAGGVARTDGHQPTARQ